MWQQQNWTILAILAMLNVVAFLNIGAMILIVPYLVKMLMGIESVFTRSGLDPGGDHGFGGGAVRGRQDQAAGGQRQGPTG